MTQRTVVEGMTVSRLVVLPSDNLIWHYLFIARLRPWETKRITNDISDRTTKNSKIKCNFDCGETEGRQVVTIPGVRTRNLSSAVLLPRTL